MGDKKGKVDVRISRICMVNGLDIDDMLKKAERFLEINHEMLWNRSIYKSRNIEESLVNNVAEINESISYLENLDCDDSDVEIEKKLKPLYDSRIMNDILSYTYMKVKDYPYEGNIYFNILSKLYFEMYKISCEDILESCSISRPSYYRKRKEALVLFGVILWSMAIPFLKENINNSVNEFRNLLLEAGRMG